MKTKQKRVKCAGCYVFLGVDVCMCGERFNYKDMSAKEIDKVLDSQPQSKLNKMRVLRNP